MGDFQGVVTLGVAGAPKRIFPYRGARFSKGVPPHVHAQGCTCPRRCFASVLLALCVGAAMYMPKGVHDPVGAAVGQRGDPKRGGAQRREVG